MQLEGLGEETVYCVAWFVSPQEAVQYSQRFGTEERERGKLCVDVVCLSFSPCGMSHNGSQRGTVGLVRGGRANPTNCFIPVFSQEGRNTYLQFLFFFYPRLVFSGIVLLGRTGV